MKEIRLYIHTNAAVSSADRAKASYMLQYLKDGTESGTRKDHMSVDSNQKGATLEAMIDALARISDGNEIPVTVICHCPGVIQSINQDLYAKWQQNGWKNSRGDEIEHADKWERVVKLLAHKTKEVKAAAPSDQDATIMKKLGAETFDPHTNIA